MEANHLFSLMLRFTGMTLGGATFSSFETGVLAGATSALGWLSTGLSFETGILIGSIINVLAFTPCDCP
jgi:hypothetical protein